MENQKQLVLTKVLLSRTPKSDSYNETDVAAALVFSNTRPIIIHLSGRTAYHAHSNFPNTEIIIADDEKISTWRTLVNKHSLNF